MVKVYTAVVVCIHPCQAVMSIKAATQDLLGHAVATPTRSFGALCWLPRRSAKTFYPSPLNHSFLVLPYLGARGAKKVHLDTSIALLKHMVVRCLHRRQTQGGDEAVLPPIYHKDLSLPATLPVGYMGPMWRNTQYTAAVPTGGTGLLGVRPAISEVVTFCTDEMDAGRSLAPMKGEGVVYSPKWYDASGKPLDCLTASPPVDPEEPPSNPEDKHEDITSVSPAPINTVGNGPDDDAKSKKASSSESESGSGSSSGSGSGSGDSSSDSSSSHSGSGEGDANSDAQSDVVTKRKVRRKKKPRKSNKDSDEAVPKVMVAETGSHSNDDVKRTSQDSGVGEGATANPIDDHAEADPMDDGANADPPGLFGLNAAALGRRYATGVIGAGCLPLPSTLPSMTTLEALTNDLEELSEKMFKSLEEANIKVYDKVLLGFKDTSGKCKDFIHNMGALVTTFFSQAEKLEQGLARCDAEALREAINASKGYVCGLIEEVADAESIYNSAEAKFDSILASVAKEVKAFVCQEGDKQRKKYKEQCLA